MGQQPLTGLSLRNELLKEIGCLKPMNVRIPALGFSFIQCLCTKLQPAFDTSKVLDEWRLYQCDTDADIQETKHATETWVDRKAAAEKATVSELLAEATAKLQAPFEADGPVNKQSMNAAFLMFNAAKEISKQADEEMEVINKKTSGPGQKTGGCSCFNACV